MRLCCISVVCWREIKWWLFTAINWTIFWDNKHNDKPIRLLHFIFVSSLWTHGCCYIIPLFEFSFIAVDTVCVRARQPNFLSLRCRHTRNFWWHIPHRPICNYIIDLSQMKRTPFGRDNEEQTRYFSTVAGRKMWKAMQQYSQNYLLLSTLYLVLSLSPSFPPADPLCKRPIPSYVILLQSPSH